MKRYVMMMVALFGFSKVKSKTNRIKMNAEKKGSEKEIIVDVRTKEEWINDGHAACSVNYPLDRFTEKIEFLKQYSRVVIVCRSGMRARIAVSKLIGAGFKNEVENLGSWQNVVCKKAMQF